MRSESHRSPRESFHHLPDDALIRQVILIAWGLVPFSASTLWRKVRRGEFPPPVKVSSGITAWRVGHVRQWLKDPRQFRNASRISQ